jgi:hypothetical protein
MNFITLCAFPKLLHFRLKSHTFLQKGIQIYICADRNYKIYIAYKT